MPPAATAAPPPSITFTVNGQERTVHVPPLRRVLDVLRLDLGLTATKEGCGEGECGACSVILDGLPVNSCLVPACHLEGAHVTTAEGLAGHALLSSEPTTLSSEPTTLPAELARLAPELATLHPIQAAFLEHGGAQCGICTPGMVVTAVWLYDNGLGKADIERVLAGNLCRCTGYSPIVASVEAALDARDARAAAGAQP